jgi:hypothetical protein
VGVGGWGGGARGWVVGRRWERGVVRGQEADGWWRGLAQGCQLQGTHTTHAAGTWCAGCSARGPGCRPQERQAPAPCPSASPSTPHPCCQLRHNKIPHTCDTSWGPSPQPPPSPHPTPSLLSSSPCCSPPASARPPPAPTHGCASCSRPRPAAPAAHATSPGQSPRLRGGAPAGGAPAVGQGGRGRGREAGSQWSVSKVHGHAHSMCRTLVHTVARGCVLVTGAGVCGRCICSVTHTSRVAAGPLRYRHR